MNTTNKVTIQIRPDTRVFVSPDNSTLLAVYLASEGGHRYNGDGTNYHVTGAELAMTLALPDNGWRQIDPYKEQTNV